MEDENFEIDPELWLQVLLTFMSDKQEKRELIEGMSQRTGIAQDKVEEILHRMAEVLVEITRSN